MRLQSVCFRLLSPQLEERQHERGFARAALSVDEQYPAASMLIDLVSCTLRMASVLGNALKPFVLLSYLYFAPPWTAAPSGWACFGNQDVNSSLNYPSAPQRQRTQIEHRNQILQPPFANDARLTPDRSANHRHSARSDIARTTP